MHSNLTPSKANAWGIKVSDLVDEREAARRIGMSVAFLRADRYRGHVGNRTVGPPFYRIGRAIRYAPADLEHWVESRRVERRGAA